MIDTTSALRAGKMDGGVTEREGEEGTMAIDLTVRSGESVERTGSYKKPVQAVISVKEPTKILGPMFGFILCSIPV
jgi:hypothetical protein